MVFSIDFISLQKSERKWPNKFIHSNTNGISTFSKSTFCFEGFSVSRHFALVNHPKQCSSIRSSFYYHTFSLSIFCLFLTLFNRDVYTFNSFDSYKVFFFIVLATVFSHSQMFSAPLTIFTVS